VQVCGAVEMARRLGPGHTIVTVLCDSGFRYGTKFFNKEWMTANGLYDALPPEHRVGIE
jgi:cysteine synthase A